MWSYFQIAGKLPSERGSMLVELALGVFVLLFLIFGVLELSNYIRIAQLAPTLSREVANVMYRECVVANKVGIEECVRIQSEQLANFIEGFELKGEKNPALTVRIWRRPRSSIGLQGNWEKVGESVGEYGAEYDTNRITRYITKNTIVVAEIWIPYTPIVPFVSSAIFGSTEEMLIHDTTIL